MIHGGKPNLSQHRIVGSLAYVLIKNQRDCLNRAKLQEKAIKGWLVGLEATNMYKVYTRTAWSEPKTYKRSCAALILTTVPDLGQALSIIIDEMDLDEEDIDLLPTMEDATQQNTKTLPLPLPTPHGSPQPTGSAEIRTQASEAYSPPSPMSITRTERGTGALALENLPSSSGS